MYEIYTKTGCTYCNQAKQLLEIRGIDYRELMLGVHFTRDELLAKFPNAKTFPQINGPEGYVGGFNELKESLTNAEA